MKVDSYETIKIRFSKLIDLDRYFDYVLLDSEDFMTKHGYYGWAFSNYFAVRLTKEVDALRTIQNFINWKKELIIMPIDAEKRIYKVSAENIYSFILDNDLNTDDFIIFHQGTKWILVKNKYNVLTGIGSYIVKRMEKNCFMTFGGDKVMYRVPNARQEKE